MLKLSKHFMTEAEISERNEYCREAEKNLIGSFPSTRVNLSTYMATSFNNGELTSFNRSETFPIPAMSIDNFISLFESNFSSHHCIASVANVIFNYFGYDYSIENILNEIERLYDENTEMFAIDEIINYIALLPENSSGKSRISNCSKIISNLSNDIIVPIKVKNEIYYNDNSCEGYHYVILFALVEGTAYVIDSTVIDGIYTLSFSTLYKSILANNDICVWDLSPCVELLKEDYN